MDITNINLAACPLQYLSIGYVGETGARPVAFDFDAWAEEYGSGVLQLLLQRPGDAEPYPVLLDIDGTTATWTPDDTDTDKAGQGQAQLVYTVGGVVVKNAIFRVLIAPSLGTAGDPPEPYEDWLERLLTIAAEAQQSAIDAAGSAEAAGTSAGAAAGSAGAAAQSALDAEAAKSGAEAAETAAGQSATLAGEKATQAAQSAEDAQAALEAAQLAADAAGTFADDAEASKTAAALSASEASQAKADAQSSASAAAASASAASGSAADAAATVTEVETKGAEQITAINQAGTTQIAAVDAAGAAQVQAIEDKGEEVLASIPSDYTELTDEVSDLKSSIDDLTALSNRKAGMLVDSVSGEIASFVPDATVPNLLGLTVDIEPVQDLHGYDSPWPAGGGVNLIDPDKCTLGVRLTNTGTTTPSTNWAVTDWIPVTAETNYIIRNSIAAANGYAVCYYDENKDFISYAVISGATDGIRKTAKNSAYARLTVAKASVEKSYYALGSAWLPFTPYSNLCPISGWDAVSIWNKPTHDTGADPTVTIQLGQTVYGGTLTINQDGSGELAVNWYGMRLLSSWGWHATSSARYYLNFSTAPAAKYVRTSADHIRCSALKSVPATVSSTDYSIMLSSERQIMCRLESSTTLDDLIHFLDANEVFAVYEMETPVTYQLTAGQIRTLAGTNNIWSNAGDVSVEFAADLKHYIDTKIAAAVAALS